MILIVIRSKVSSLTFRGVKQLQCYLCVSFDYLCYIYEKATTSYGHLERSHIAIFDHPAGLDFLILIWHLGNSPKYLGMGFFAFHVYITFGERDPMFIFVYLPGYKIYQVACHNLERS